MSERKSNEHELGKAIVGLIEQDLSHDEIGRRLGVSRYRIGQVATAHGLEGSAEELMEMITVRRVDGREIPLERLSVARALRVGETVRAAEIVIRVPDELEIERNSEDSVQLSWNFHW